MKKNYLLVLLVLWGLVVSFIGAEEMVIIDSNVLSEEYRVKLPAEIQNKEVTKVLLLKDDGNLYTLEVHYKTKQGIARVKVPIEENMLKDAIDKNKKEENSWELEIDHGASIWGTTVNTVIYSSIVSEKLKLDSTLRAAFVGASAIGTYTYTTELSNNGFFKKRDHGLMTDTAAAALLYAAYIKDFKGEDNSLLYGTAYYGGYWGGKLLADKYNLRQSSGSMGLRWYLISSALSDSLIGSENKTLKQSLNLVAGPAVFMSGAFYAKENQVSTGGMALMDTYSDSLFLMFNAKSPGSDKTKLELGLASSLVPYLFPKYFEDRINFYENDNNMIKAGEVVGVLAGVALNAIFKTNEDISTNQFIIGASIAGMNFFSQSVLEKRTGKENKSLAIADENFKINPTALIYPAMKINGGGELFSYKF